MKFEQQRICSQGKQIGSKFLPFSVDPFPEGHWGAGKQTGHKSFLPCIKKRKIYKVHQVPLNYMYARHENMPI